MRQAEAAASYIGPRGARRTVARVASLKIHCRGNRMPHRLMPRIDSPPSSFSFQAPPASVARDPRVFATMSPTISILLRACGAPRAIIVARAAKAVRASGSDLPRRGVTLRRIGSTRRRVLNRRRGIRGRGIGAANAAPTTITHRAPASRIAPVRPDPRALCAAPVAGRRAACIALHVDRRERMQSATTQPGDTPKRIHARVSHCSHCSLGERWSRGAAQAQFSLGLKAGASFATLSSKAPDWKSRTGFAGGLAFDFRAKVIGLEPEVLYVQKGVDFKTEHRPRHPTRRTSATSTCRFFSR